MIPPPLLSPPVLTWGSTIERERRNRILIAIYAYAYELRQRSLVSDTQYDSLARRIRPSIDTGHPACDLFFATHYSADTGMWIYRHPELSKIATLYERYYAC